MISKIQYVAPLSEVEFKRIFDSTHITKAQYDELLGVISERFSYVFEKYREIIGLPLDYSFDWFDFDTVGGEDTEGYFDPTYYKNMMRVTGRFDDHVFFDKYECSLPTSWLYTEFEDALTAEYEKAQQQHIIAKETAKLKEANTKKRKVQLQASIKSKLSKEELACIKFI